MRSPGDRRDRKLFPLRMSLSLRVVAAVACGAMLGMSGCANRPVNPPLAHADPSGGYRFENREMAPRYNGNVIILAFSGGGTRAAAFSYGVLEALRNMEFVDHDGRKARLLDDVGAIAGVSGGSFTALAYGLYGETLFGQYEQRFLKRDVEGELIRRLFDPYYWGSLSSTGWGRSELAAQYYDEILFEGATFADLERGSGPMIVATATDVSSGARFYYSQTMFDVICSQLGSVNLSRAAASSSAVPVVLSPVTLNNYGGTCDYREPAWVKRIAGLDRSQRPAARVLQQITDMRAYTDSADRPYIHLVDGGISDNLAMRGIIDILDAYAAQRLAELPTPLDRLKRILVLVVNSLSTPKTDWDKSVSAPGPINVLLQASGVPIDYYSYETIDVLLDMAARWRMLRGIRESGAIIDGTNPALIDVMRVPDTEIYVVDVSFAKVKDPEERAFLNNLPTSFVLSSDEVDRLRAAAVTVVGEAPELQRYVRDIGVRPGASAMPR